MCKFLGKLKLVELQYIQYFSLNPVKNQKAQHQIHNQVQQIAHHQDQLLMTRTLIINNKKHQLDNNHNKIINHNNYHLLIDYLLLI